MIKIITQYDAELEPRENLGRDIFLNSQNDLVIGSNNDFVTIRYHDNLKQAIVNRLKTQLGELELHQLYGSKLSNLIGTNVSELTLSSVKMFVKDALLQEPRIFEIIDIEPEFDKLDPTKINVLIRVKPIEDLAELNLIFALFIS